MLCLKVRSVQRFMGVCQKDIGINIKELPLTKSGTLGVSK